MDTKIIKGDLIKELIFDEVKKEISELSAKYHKTPGIAFIGFWGTPLAIYNIPLHIQLAEAAGFKVYSEIKTEMTSEQEMFKLIDKLNDNRDIHAIVLFQPLPENLNPIRLINRIDRNKEVEGFHPENMMRTMIPDIRTNKTPMCLPIAMLELMKNANYRLKKDQEWVFVLDDVFIANTLTHMIVKSAASKAVPHDCPMTIINKNSRHLIDYCKRADILIVVSKSPEYIQPEWLKPGVCIVDVYSNLVNEIPSKKDPAKLIPIIRGGVNVESVNHIAGAIIPVPGGVVGVVIPLLLCNALTSFKNSLKTESLKTKDHGVYKTT